MILAFGMLMFQAWEIKTLRTELPPSPRKIVPEIYFRHVEKTMLYLAKYVVQSIVLGIAKFWFIISTKTKKYVVKNLPKIHTFFKKKSKNLNQQKNTFIQKAILESKSKIRKIKEKVKKDHGEQIK